MIKAIIKKLLVNCASGSFWISKGKSGYLPWKKEKHEQKKNDSINLHIHCITDSGKYITSACVENTKFSLQIALDSSYLWWEKLIKKIIEIYHYLWKILFIIEKSWKLENENDKIKRFLKIFIIESLEWTPTEWKVPHIIERTANMHYAFSGHDRSFEDWKFRARLDRLHNMCRAKTHCNRDRFVAIKHGMQTPYANVVSFDLQPRNRFIIGDTVISQVHACEFRCTTRDSCRKHVNDELIEMTKRRRRK